ncbi:MAG: hypothetical protein ACU85V_00225 [Gammaproteobacteria bacterium]
MSDSDSESVGVGLPPGVKVSPEELVRWGAESIPTELVRGIIERVQTCNQQGACLECGFGHDDCYDEFEVDAHTEAGIEELLDHLRGGIDELPWQMREAVAEWIEARRDSFEY